MEADVRAGAAEHGRRRCPRRRRRARTAAAGGSDLGSRSGPRVTTWPAPSTGRSHHVVPTSGSSGPTTPLDGRAGPVRTCNAAATKASLPPVEADVQVGAVDLDLGQPEAAPGWPGRCPRGRGSRRARGHGAPLPVRHRRPQLPEPPALGPERPAGVARRLAGCQGQRPGTLPVAAVGIEGRGSAGQRVLGHAGAGGGAVAEVADDRATRPPGKPAGRHEVRRGQGLEDAEQVGGRPLDRRPRARGATGPVPAWPDPRRGGQASGRQRARGRGRRRARAAGRQS